MSAGLTKPLFNLRRLISTRANRFVPHCASQTDLDRLPGSVGR